MKRGNVYIGIFIGGKGDKARIQQMVLKVNQLQDGADQVDMGIAVNQ